MEFAETDGPGESTPIVFLACCACATNGPGKQGVTAAPPRSVMNARRFMMDVPDPRQKLLE
jgi:hypothetical protein